MWNFAEAQDVDSMSPELRKENCLFKGVSRNKEDQSVTFHFVDSTKAKLDHREFVPKRRNETQSDEDFKKDANLVASRLRHIARAFLTEEEFMSIKVEGDPNDPKQYPDHFAAVTKQIGLLLRKKMQDTDGNANPNFDGKCALKVTLRESKGKYYSSFPMVAPFISTTNHPKDFKFDPNYDKLEIPLAKPDSEKFSQAPGAAGGQQAGFQTPNTAKSGADNDF